MSKNIQENVLIESRGRYASVWYETSQSVLTVGKCLLKTLEEKEKWTNRRHWKA